MRQLFKLYQFWLGIGVLAISLFLGWGLPMIVPSTPQNGILITLIGAGVSIPLFIKAYRLYKRQKAVPQPLEEAGKLNLSDTLTAMHRRLAELQKDKASRTKITYTKWRKVMPTLADRVGIVKLKDWHKFERDMASRLRRALPRRNLKRLSKLSNPKHWFIESEKWRNKSQLAVLAVVSQWKDETAKSREWTFDDGLRISKWLDGYDWGVRKLRDDDSEWEGLFESISNYLKDVTLRNLIQKHIDFSLMCNNIRLLTDYSGKFKDDVFSMMLHEALVGSPISPEEVEVALSEILGDIEKRLKETKEIIQSKLAVGGLIGKAENVKVKDSHSKVKITIQGKAEEVDAGGLIGQSENTEVVNSSADAEIEYKQDKE